MTIISRRKFIKRSALALISIFLLDIFWFEKAVIKWKHFDISKDYHKKITAIQLSDLHLKSVNRIHRPIAKKINNLNPELIFITGDAIDDSQNLDLLDAFLKLINKGIKKFAILGNWEYWGHVDLVKLKELYKTHNCQLLINQSEQIKIKERNISIIGIDDFVGGNADYKKAINKLIPSETNIVLTHCPEHRDIIEIEKGNLKIDLVLSGHTHGGQINIFGYAPFKPQGSGNYLSGWYKKSEPILYVSKGIGTSILPIRFGARAEVTIFEI
jgi:predicted MPP superfamily phosphohydrolase